MTADFEQKVKSYDLPKLKYELRDLCQSLHVHLTDNLKDIINKDEPEIEATLEYLTQMIITCLELQTRLVRVREQSIKEH